MLPSADEKPRRDLGYLSAHYQRFLLTKQLFDAHDHPAMRGRQLLDNHAKLLLGARPILGLEATDATLRQRLAGCRNSAHADVRAALEGELA
jgi:hypothetical protein